MLLVLGFGSVNIMLHGSNLYRAGFNLNMKYKAEFRTPHNLRLGFTNADCQWLSCWSCHSGGLVELSWSNVLQSLWVAVAQEVE